MTLKETTYWDHFRDRTLRKHLAREDNIPILENLLEEELEEMEKIEASAKDQSLECEVSEEELGRTFVLVHQDVSSFLELEVTPPSYGYKTQSQMTKKLDKNFVRLMKGSAIAHVSSLAADIGGHIALMKGWTENVLLFNEAWNYVLHPVLETTEAASLVTMFTAGLYAFGLRYFPEKLSGDHYHQFDKHVFIKKQNRTSLIPTLGHEIAHHMQTEVFGCLDFKLSFSLHPVNSYKIFQEGHARGVERHIARKYAENEKNIVFKKGINKKTRDELAAVYLWLCTNHGTNPREELLKQKSPFSRFVARNFYPDNHAAGNALFSIWATEYGESLYRNILHEDVEIA